MAKKQWVNLPEDDKTYTRANLMGDGIDDVDHMGRFVHIRAELDKSDANKVVVLFVEPGGDNADYDVAENKLTAIKVERGAVTDEGKADFKIRLSAAGGDTFKFKVADKDGTEKELPDEIETHRKVYVQVIGMDTIFGRQAVAAVMDLGFVKAEYKSKKRNIDLEVTASGKTITHRWNHYSEMHQVDMFMRFETGSAYDMSKEPFGFVCLFADCLADGPERFIVKEVPAKRAGAFRRAFGLHGVDVPFNLPSGYLIWKDIDKDPNAEPWLVKAEFIPDGGGSRIDVRKDATLKGRSAIKIGTKNLPDGVTGRFRVELNVSESCSGGYSWNHMNMVLIGTRSDEDEMFTAQDLKNVILHEFGHKLGLVPKGGGDLLEQPSHDTSKPAHCKDKGCVMWWQMNGSKNFCGDCQKSLRKINLYCPELKNFNPFYK